MKRNVISQNHIARPLPFRRIAGFISARKKFTLWIVAGLLFLLVIGIAFRRNKSSSATIGNSVSKKVEKRFDFPAINNQGIVEGTRLAFTISEVEKTEQVIVKDQTYVAKNNKIFLIVNVSIKNDTTTPLNIIPGDLIRLTYDGKDSDQYAPDLHNNLVAVAPISTKLDRVGFVVPNTAKKFTLYIGELSGNKEQVNIQFPT